VEPSKCYSNNNIIDGLLYSLITCSDDGVLTMDGTCLISRTLDPDTVQLQESERVSTPSFPNPTNSVFFL
jgi:hypothetical protein